MKTRISALMDGELDGHEAEEALHSLRRDAELRTQWHEFHLIGAALRGEPELDVDIAAQVMLALEAEPTVLIPAVKRKVRHLRPLMALAASAAGVALVAWVALGTPPNSAGDPARGVVSPQLVATPVERIQPVAASVPGESIKLQDYLLAHHAHAPMAAVANGARYVRVVSVEREGR